MAGQGRRRRWSASLGLLSILVVASTLVGGAIAAVVSSAVGETPSDVQEDRERADARLGRCRANRDQMSATVRVTNHSTGQSSYFVDVEFVRRPARAVVETVPLVVDDLRPGRSRRIVVEGTRPGRRSYDCRLGDVDRMRS